MRGRWCYVCRDDEQDGYFVVVYTVADLHSRTLVSEWLPTLEALNYFLRDQNWQPVWATGR